MGAAAAAIIIRREKEVVAAFRRARATSPERSVTSSDLYVAERLAFQILRRRNVLVETEPGRYYLDETAWAAMTRRRRTMVLVMMVILLALTIGAMVITLRATKAQ